MANCPACGARHDEGARECPRCGARLHGATASFEPVHGETPAEAPILDGLTTPVLIVEKGAEVGERFYLEGDELSVGRDPESDIFLNDITVSRHHAVISTSPDGVSVEDAGSLNGTSVNGVCVDKARLRSGDVLQIGRFRMVFLQGGGV